MNNHRIPTFMLAKRTNATTLAAFLECTDDAPSEFSMEVESDGIAAIASDAIPPLDDGSDDMSSLCSDDDGANLDGALADAAPAKASAEFM